MRNREWHRRNNWPSFAEQASISLFLLPAKRRTSLTQSIADTCVIFDDSTLTDRAGVAHAWPIIKTLLDKYKFSSV